MIRREVPKVALTTSRSTKKVLLIANPHAGSRWRRRQLPQVLHHVQSVYPKTDIRLTAAKGEATRLARWGVEQAFDLIVCAGGDGTVNEVINGMALSTVPLGIIPLGTGNGLAREIGLSTRPLRAAAALENPRIRTIPLGQANDRYFSLIAGTGIDAFTMDQTDTLYPGMKRFLGVLSYFWVGLLAIFRYSSPSILFRVDGQTYRGTSGTVARGRLFLWRFPITPLSLYDHKLCLCLVEGRGPLHYLWVAGAFLLSLGRLRRVRYIFGQAIEIDSEEPLSYEVDGEKGGRLPVRMRLVPDGLRLAHPPSDAKGF